MFFIFLMIKNVRNGIFLSIYGSKDMFILDFAQKMIKLIIKWKLLKLNTVLLYFLKKYQ